MKPRSRQFQPIGPAQCARIYKAAGKVSRVTQVFKQRALAARQIIRPIEHAKAVIAESQFKLMGCNGFDVKQLNHGRHTLLPKRILQPHRKIKHRLTRRVVHPVGHKVAMPLKLKLLIRLRVGQ